MISLIKLKKRFLQKDQFKIIRNFNKLGNFVSYKSEVDSFTLLDGKCLIGESSIKSSTIGMHTIIGSSCELNNCKIGKFCSISSSVRVVAGCHPTNFVSTYSGFYKNIERRFPYGQIKFEEYLKTKDGFFCEIGNDVWIGRNVLIKGGVIIGNGAIIGMGSVVTKDVPPYSIVAGVPARFIRYRFNDEQIKKIESIRWWEWTNEDILKNKNDFDDIEKFIDKYYESF